MELLREPIISGALLYLLLSAVLYWRLFPRTYGAVHRLGWRWHLTTIATRCIFAIAFPLVMIFLRLESVWWDRITYPRRRSS